MGELILFLLAMIGFGIYDILKMKKADLKREIVPYLAMMFLAGGVGLVYLLNPTGPSIAKMLFGLFNIKG